MELLAIAFVPAVIAWGVIAASRVSIVTMAVLFILATSCLPAEFFAVHAGGLSWTIDRMVFVGLVGTAVIGIKQGKLSIRPLEAVDCLLLLFLIWLTARTLTVPLGSVHKLQPHTLMHLINGYCVPAAIYFVIRSAKLELKSLRPAFWIVACTGLYLSITAILEVAKVWSLVYPKFIGDPALGIHFGRARGPMLQSVRLGVCLLACTVIVFVYTVWLNPLKRTRWLLATATLPLLVLAIGLTYTRSIWMGLIAIAAIAVVLCLRGRTRRAVLVTCGMAGVAAAIVIGPQLVAFKREYSAAETRESTYMRAAFAYVSLEMIKERPVAGFGFNQFNVANLPYLSDRSTDIRLESIRGYVHHNSYLSLLVDLGIVGFMLYALVIAAWLRESWRIWRDQHIPAWGRGTGLVAISVAAVHFIQMAFHEVSFSSIENGILMSCFGMVLAVRRQFARSEHDEGSAEDGSPVAD